MITRIYIKNLATYVEGIDFQPKKINFIYGANGSGKSTISKLISGEKTSSESGIDWSATTHEKAIVYNRTFVKNNFHSTLKGIFTLGEDTNNLQEQIKQKRKDVENASAIKEGYQKSIKEIDAQLQKLRLDIEKKCWEVQKNYGGEFAEALSGARGSKKDFCNECLSYIDCFEDATILEFQDLKNIYQAVYTKSAVPDTKYRRLPIEKVEKLNSHKLLSEAIVGKTDSSIGTFIEYLKSSDWVKEGIGYAHRSDGKCPYCQRELPSNIQKEIEDYFDEHYENSRKELLQFITDYEELARDIKAVIQDISERFLTYIDYADFEIKKVALIAKLDVNIQTLKQKMDKLSDSVEIESILELVTELDNLISNYNQKISENNTLIENQSTEKDDCKKKIWMFLAWQCRDAMVEYNKEKNGQERGKNSLVRKLNQQNNAIKLLEIEIAEKEAQTTSVLPTVNAINNILRGFGFTGFLLAQNEEERGTYKIVRPSGDDASETLSEGEYNFISFLYFYHLCFGSHTQTGVSDSKILVIDDPISSMDNNVLFIVSTLVKEMLRYCKNNEKGIKQVIVLTHNTYFYKEITFWGNKDALPSTNTRYYILRKTDENTKIEEHTENPISTSYELLWKELKNPNITSCNTVLNVMRRILEHYFTVIGGIDYENCINSFEGTDRIVCKALIAFINDGSHAVFENQIFMPDEDNIEKYRIVFQKVFEKLHHEDHYNMMMRKS